MKTEFEDSEIIDLGFKNVGYVIVNDSAEFLHDFKFSQSSQFLGWSLLPDLAKVFKTRSQASGTIKKLSFSYPVYVVQLLESEFKYAFISDSKNIPSWLRDSVTRPSGARRG